MVRRLGPDLETAWPKMTVDERQAVMRILVTTVQVGRAMKRGGNKFDPTRITFGWRSGGLAEVIDRWVHAGGLTTGGEPFGVIWNPSPEIAAVFQRLTCLESLDSLPVVRIAWGKVAALKSKKKNKGKGKSKVIV